MAALGAIAAAAQAAEARVRGDQAAVDAAVEAGERLLAHGRMCAVVGQPRSVSLGPEGRAWLARLEAAASCLAGRGDAGKWAAAAAAFGYGAVYEQAICRRHEAEALLLADDVDGAASRPEAAARRARSGWARSRCATPSATWRTAPASTWRASSPGPGPRGGRPADRPRARRPRAGGPRAARTARSAKSCTSARRRSACTCPGSWRSSARAAARRPSRSPTTEAC